MIYMTFLVFLAINSAALQEINPPKPGRVPLGPILRPEYDETDESLADLEETSSENSECEAKCDLGDEILIDYEMKLENDILVDSRYKS